MKCYFHNQEEAVASCQRCGRFLCSVCAGKYNPCLCEDCAALSIEVEKQESDNSKREALADTKEEFIQYTMYGVVGFIIGALLGYFLNDNNLGVAIVFGLMCFFVPYGWSTISYLLSFLPIMILPIYIFIIWYVFKFAISIFFGIPCFLFQLIRYLWIRHKIKAA